MYSAPCKYTLGQTVQLCYNPERPEVMEIEEDSASNAGAVVLIPPGVFFSMAGAAMLYYIKNG